MKNKNIDFLRVNKSNRSQLYIESDSKSFLSSKSLPSKSSKPNRNKLLTKSKLAENKYFTGIFESISIQTSIFRSLLSVRTLFFILLPVIIYQLKYITVLNPGQLLLQLKSLIAPESSFSFVVSLCLALVIIFLGLVINTTLFNILLQHKFYIFINKKVSILNIAKNSISIVLTGILQRSFNAFILLATIMLGWLTWYFVSLFGYGSSIVLVVTSIFIIIILSIVLAYYRFYSYYTLAGVAISNDFFIDRNLSVISVISEKPTATLATAIKNVLLLITFVAIGLIMALVQVFALEASQSVSLSILYLAIYSTLAVVIWSVWISWNTSFWQKSFAQNNPELSKNFDLNLKNDYTGLLILTVIFIGLFLVYWLSVFIFSDQIATFVQNLSSAIPGSFDFNIPGPNKND